MEYKYEASYRFPMVAVNKKDGGAICIPITNINCLEYLDDLDVYYVSHGETQTNVTRKEFSRLTELLTGCKFNDDDSDETSPQN